MKYDFTSIMDRRGKDAAAIDALGTFSGFTPDKPSEGFDAIPMWIADMNFPTCPAIPQAIIQRAEHPAYGYFMPPTDYFEKIISWHKKRNGVSGLLAEHIGYENGVIGGVINALNVLCSRGDSVLVHSPTYIGFTDSLSNNGYHIVHSPLAKDSNAVWRMDYEDMEAKIVKHKIHAAILCSPHNPMGRVWQRWELEKALEIYQKHNVWVISDEIWSDLLLYGHKHIPTQSVNEWAKNHTVALYSPSKTFNLAGLVGSYRIVYNQWLQDRLQKESSLSHYNEMNVLSMHALLGAYSPEGNEWVNELCQTLTSNVEYAVRYMNEHFDGVETTQPEGTYMLFVDCSQWCKKHGWSIDQLEKACWNVGVAVQDGQMFHGPCHIRMNLALPLSRIKEALYRLDQYVFNSSSIDTQQI